VEETSNIEESAASSSLTPELDILLKQFIITFFIRTFNFEYKKVYGGLLIACM
jgi:hypothetical protein